MVNGSTVNTKFKYQLLPINSKHKMLFRAKQRVRTQIVGWVQYVINQTLSDFNKTRPFRVLILSGFWITTTAKDHRSKSSQSLFKQNSKNTVGYPQKQKLPTAKKRQQMKETQLAGTKTNPALRTCHQNRKQPGADIPQPLHEPTSPTQRDPCERRAKKLDEGGLITIKWEDTTTRKQNLQRRITNEIGSTDSNIGDTNDGAVTYHCRPEPASNKQSIEPQDLKPPKIEIWRKGLNWKSNKGQVTERWRCGKKKLIAPPIDTL